MTNIDPETQCNVCGIKLPALLPCGVAPRIYVGHWGHILGAIDGCPYEPARDPDYVPIEALPRMALWKRDIILSHGKELASAENYQGLWSARNGQNYHLDFDAQRRLGIWQAGNEGRLHHAYKGSVRRSKKEGD